jgi:hypothetical protein
MMDSRLYHLKHKQATYAATAAVSAVQASEVLVLLCRYTGYIQGLQETYKKTPIMAQVETKTPGEESFIHTRTCSPPNTTYHSMQRDPCNFSENFKKPEVDNLWPRLQERAAQV